MATIKEIKSTNKKGETMRTSRTIPDEVLSKITEHRPHLRRVVNNLRQAECSPRVGALEKTIADAYLLGETKLTGPETWALSFCSAGKPYQDSHSSTGN